MGEYGCCRRLLAACCMRSGGVRYGFGAWRVCVTSEVSHSSVADRPPGVHLIWHVFTPTFRTFIFAVSNLDRSVGAICCSRPSICTEKLLRCRCIALASCTVDMKRVFGFAANIRRLGFNCRKIGHDPPVPVYDGWWVEAVLVS